MAAPFDLNLRHLQAVSAIVAQGTMGAAAHAVSLSQPALTQGLAKLERQLGVTLFLRRADGMEPTPDGLILADRADRAMEYLARGARGGVQRRFSVPERLMTASQLRAFIAMADTGGYLAAHRQSGLSQPAVHRAIRELEQILGVPITDRKGRGVVLTERGRKLARGARLAAVELAAAIADISAVAGGSTIRIGAMPLSRTQLLPRAVVRFLQRWPKTELVIVEGSWRDLVEPLRDGTLDCMIGALRDDSAPSDLTQLPLFDDRPVVVARPDHPILRGGEPHLDELGRYPWIVGPPGSPLRLHWARLFEGENLPHAPIECASVLANREILAASDFLTLLSPDQIAMEVKAGVLAHVGAPIERCVRSIGVTTRHGWKPTRLQHDFLDLLGEVAVQ